MIRVHPLSDPGSVVAQAADAIGADFEGMMNASDDGVANETVGWQLLISEGMVSSFCCIVALMIQILQNDFANECYMTISQNGTMLPWSLCLGRSWTNSILAN